MCTLLGKSTFKDKRVSFQLTYNSIELFMYSHDDEPNAFNNCLRNLTAVVQNYVKTEWKWIRYILELVKKLVACMTTAGIVGSDNSIKYA